MTINFTVGHKTTNLFSQSICESVSFKHLDNKHNLDTAAQTLSETHHFIFSFDGIIQTTYVVFKRVVCTFCEQLHLKLAGLRNTHDSRILDISVRAALCHIT